MMSIPVLELVEDQELVQILGADTVAQKEEDERDVDDDRQGEDSDPATPGRSQGFFQKQGRGKANPVLHATEWKGPPTLAGGPFQSSCYFFSSLSPFFSIF